MILSRRLSSCQHYELQIISYHFSFSERDWDVRCSLWHCPSRGSRRRRCTSLSRIIRVLIIGSGQSASPTPSIKFMPQLKGQSATHFALLLPLEFRCLDDATEFAGLKSSAALPAVVSVTTLSDRLSKGISGHGATSLRITLYLFLVIFFFGSGSSSSSSGMISSKNSNRSFKLSSFLYSSSLKSSSCSLYFFVKAASKRVKALLAVVSRSGRRLIQK